MPLRVTDVSKRIDEGLGGLASSAERSSLLIKVNSELNSDAGCTEFVYLRVQQTCVLRV